MRQEATTGYVHLNERITHCVCSFSFSNSLPLSFVHYRQLRPAQELGSQRAHGANKSVPVDTSAGAFGFEHSPKIKIKYFHKKKKLEEKLSADLIPDIPAVAAEVVGKAEPDTQVVPAAGDRCRCKINDKSTPLSRRILLQCQRVLGQEWFFVTDGAKIAYSITAIPNRYDVTQFKEDEAGIVVLVKEGCNKNDIRAPYVGSKKYQIFFVPVGDKPFTLVMQHGKVDPSSHKNLPRFNIVLHLLLNNASMKAGLISTKQNPNRYYFPPATSQIMLDRNFLVSNNSHPLLGLTQSMNLAVNGSLQIQSDFLLGWFESAFWTRALLDPEARTLAGVPVDLSRPITNPTTQQAIKDVLKPLLLNSEYKRGTQ